MKLEPKNTPLTAFSMASLTDMVMLLLIFFLLSSSYILQPGIKVELPPSETAQVIDQKSIIVTVTKDGTIWLGQEKVNLGGLAGMLRQQLISGTQQTVVIKADKDVKLDLAIRVIDRIKAAGSERFLIATLRDGD
jgi:biopolymer transport protein ExbD